MVHILNEILGLFRALRRESEAIVVSAARSEYNPVVDLAKISREAPTLYSAPAPLNREQRRNKKFGRKNRP